MFSTTNPDRFADLIGNVAPGVHARALSRKGFQVTGEVRALRNAALFSVSSTSLGVQTEPGRGYLGITLPIAGMFTAKCSEARRAFAGHEAHILHPDREFDFRSSANNHVLVLNVFKQNVDEVLNRLNGQDDADGPGLKANLETLHLSKGRGRSFSRTIDFAWSELNRGELGAFAAGRAVDDLENMMVSVFLSALDEQGTHCLRQDGLRNGAKAGRKAEEFIEAHLSEQLSLADIAASASVPARTLYRVFQGHHGLGVMEFVRKRRLIKARQLLQITEPAPGMVTRIAMDTGFWHFGRFSSAYRREFGESPSDTLWRR